MNITIELFVHDIDRIAAALERIADRFQPPPEPSDATTQVLSQRFNEDNSVKMLTFKVQFPPSTASDTAVRAGTVTLPDGTVINATGTGPGAYESAEAEVEENAVVTCTQQDTDANGNASPVHTNSITITDTIPPPEAGDAGAVVLSQRDA